MPQAHIIRNLQKLKKSFDQHIAEAIAQVKKEQAEVARLKRQRRKLSRNREAKTKPVRKRTRSRR